jgi:SAM-dependent methyltransferase
MLPYFYQDWGGTSAFDTVARLVGDALRGHGADTRSVAVLGAGAGGLAYHLASTFDTVHALDLSLPTLLVAKSILDGDEIEVHLQKANWKSATLRRGGPHLTNIRLAVGDASLIPLATGSVSAVVTQYLMDIVPDTMAAMSEIRRVLMPSGVWVNLSLPMRLPGDVPGLPPLGMAGVSSILNGHGFSVLESRYEEFRLLDLSALDRRATGTAHRPQFFAARAVNTTGGLIVSSLDEPLSDDWWLQRPEMNASMTVSVTRTDNLWPPQTTHGHELRINGKRFSLTDEQSRCLTYLFEGLDGRRSLAEIFRGLLACGIVLDEMAFHELISTLRGHHGILVTTPHRSA